MSVNLDSAGTIFGKSSYPTESAEGDAGAFDDFEQVAAPAPRNQSRVVVVNGENDTLGGGEPEPVAAPEVVEEPTVKVQYDASRRVPAVWEVDWVAKWNNGFVNNDTRAKKDDARMCTNLSSAFRVGIKWADAKALLANPKTADQVVPRSQFGNMKVRFAPDAEQGYRLVMELIPGDEESQQTYDTFAGPYREGIQAFMDQAKVRKHLRNNNFAPGHPVKEEYFNKKENTNVECQQISMTLAHSKGADRKLFCDIFKYDAGTDSFVPAPATEILPGAVVTGEWTPEWLVPTKDGIMDQRVIRRLWILVPGEARAAQNRSEVVVGVDINRMAATAKRMRTGN